MKNDFILTLLFIIGAFMVCISLLLYPEIPPICIAGNLIWTALSFCAILTELNGRKK